MTPKPNTPSRTPSRTPSATRDLPPRDWHGIATWAGLTLVLFGALARVFTTFEPLPWWDPSPLSSTWSPPAGLSPVALASLDLLLIAGSVLLIGASRTLPRTLAVLLGLLAIGSVPVLVYAAARSDHASLGLHWLGAVWGGVGVSTLGRASMARRIAVALVLGIIAMLVAKGVLQVLFEWPATLDAFRAERGKFLTDRGWAPDSDLARAYERRLSGGEATAWFGLSNVLATFAGAACVAFGLLTFTTLRDTTRTLAQRANGAVVPVMGLALAVTGLVLTGSKAGYAVVGGAVIGAVATAVLPRLLPRLLPRSLRSRVPDWAIAPAVVIGLVLAVLGAIAVRGVIGDRSGELSVWFRWFYLSTAGEIFVHHPLTGVGPAGFRDAYTLLKPALSPEEVTSPHSLPFDWLATLGVGGLAWIGLLAAAAIGAARNLATGLSSRRATDSASSVWNPDPNTLHQAWLGAVLLAIAAAVPGLMIARPMLTIEAAVSAMVGLGLWLALVRGLTRPSLPARSLDAAMALGAVAVLLHAQLDVAPVWPNAAALAGVMLGLGAGGFAPSGGREQSRADHDSASDRVKEREGGSRRSLVVRGMLLAPTTALAATVGVVTLGAFIPWERSLEHAVGPALEVGRAQADLDRASAPETSPSDAEHLIRGVADRAARELGRPMPRSAQDADRVMTDWRVALLSESRDRLDPALRARPADLPTLRAAVTIDLAIDSTTRDPDRPGLRRAIDAAERLAEQRPDASGPWAFLSSLYELAATDQTGGRGIDPPSDGTEPERKRDDRFLAISTREIAASLDPHGLSHARALVRLMRLAGDPEAAGDWARRALAIDDNLRLDPVRQLTPSQRAELERIAAWKADSPNPG